MMTTTTTTTMMVAMVMVMMSCYHFVAQYHHCHFIASYHRIIVNIMFLHRIILLHRISQGKTYTLDINT